MNKLSLLERPRGRGPFDIEDVPADVAPMEGLFSSPRQQHRFEPQNPFPSRQNRKCET